MTSEKSFQNYLMRQVPHGYRTNIGGGFPDVLLINEESHFLIELKLLSFGPTGDKMLRGLYKPTQPPWHLNYFLKGGKSLFTIFKMEGKYGVIKETPEYVRALLDGLKYSGLVDYDYKEFKVLKDLIGEISEIR